jgi:hypothetical protein
MLTKNVDAKFHQLVSSFYMATNTAVLSSKQKGDRCSANDTGNTQVGSVSHGRTSAGGGCGR